MATVTKFQSGVVVADVEISGEVIGQRASRSGIVHFDTRYNTELKSASAEVSLYDATGLDDDEEYTAKKALIVSARYEAILADLKRDKLAALESLAEQHLTLVKAREEAEFAKLKEQTATAFAKVNEIANETENAA